MEQEIGIQMKRIPLFNEHQIHHFMQMKQENMFSYTLRNLVLPPISDTKSLKDERLMERSGVGWTRNARNLLWYENESEAFEHHAKYLKRLSKLREELIHQEQSNLANALDRLKLRSYGREFVYGHHEKEKKTRQRNSSQTETGSKRNSLLTTFEKFQKMRPKKVLPEIMPIEGKALIETSAVTSDMSGKFEHRHTGSGSDRCSEQSINESVRTNLQRLTAYSRPNIPRQCKNYDMDLVIESSSLRRHENHEPTVSNAEDKIAIMQKQNKKLKRIRDEVREAEKQRLMPQSFKLDTISDEDRMNLDKLKDYCIYYVPGPTTSPQPKAREHINLPKINTNASLSNSVESDMASTITNARRHSYNGKHVGYRVTTDFPMPPCVCNCSCKMFVNGNKVESPLDQYDASTNSANNSYEMFDNVLHKSDFGNSHESSTSTEKSWQYQKSTSKMNSQINPREKKRIRVDMPSIVYNSSHTPEPMESDSNSGLAKLFKQKELRQRELSNLIEDMKELNKRTETLSSSIL